MTRRHAALHLTLLLALLALAGCEGTSIVRDADCQMNAGQRIVLEFFHGVSPIQHEREVGAGVSDIGFFEFETDFPAPFAFDHNDWCEADWRGLAAYDGELWDVWYVHENGTPGYPHDDAELYLQCHILTL